MTKEELTAVFKETFDKCLDTMEKKNHDYAGDKDALKNFKLVDYLGIATSAQGILVRLCDKFSRLANVYKGDNKVKDETVEDTIDDAINYLVILKAVLRQEKLPKPKLCTCKDKAVKPVSHKINIFHLGKDASYEE